MNTNRSAAIYDNVRPVVLCTNLKIKCPSCSCSAGVARFNPFTPKSETHVLKMAPDRVARSATKQPELADFHYYSSNFCTNKVFERKKKHFAL